MKPKHPRNAIPILFLSATVAACAANAGPSNSTSPQTNTETAELEALYYARTDSALARFNDADVRFMTGMIGHHGQALVMAALAPTNGASPAVRRLCARIINAQKDEIATMQQWLRDRNQTVPEIHIEGTEMMVHGPDYAMHMPGMLSAEQLLELEEARGSEFDRLFLTYMIQHHRGAVTMVHELFESDGAMQDDFIFKVASDIQADQSTEIERMELMLETLSDAQRP